MIGEVNVLDVVSGSLVIEQGRLTSQRVDWYVTWWREIEQTRLVAILS